MKDYLERDLQGGVVKQPAEVVYVLWGGANDYISKEPFTGDIGTLLDSPEGKGGYRRIVNEAVASLAEQVRRLYAAGGRRFVVMNLPNLGRTPIVLQNQSYLPSEKPRRRRSGACCSRASSASSPLPQLRSSRPPSARLDRELPEAQFVRSMPRASWTRSSRAAPPTPGASASTTASRCASSESDVRAGRRGASFQKRCYAGGYLGSLDSSSVCRQSANAMFWDVVHPTSYTHCWVAYFVQRELAQAGLAAAPAPVAEQRAYCTARTQPAW